MLDTTLLCLIFTVAVLCLAVYLGLGSGGFLQRAVAVDGSRRRTRSGAQQRPRPNGARVFLTRRAFEGKVVLIDASHPLTRGAKSNPLAMLAEPLRPVPEANKFVEQLIDDLFQVGVAGVIVVLECNGGKGPKAAESRTRATQREEAKQKYDKAIADDDTEAARAAGSKYVKQSEDQHHRLLAFVQTHIHVNKIQVTYAPFETDPVARQLSDLKLCDIVIANDTDMWLYGINHCIYGHYDIASKSFPYETKLSQLYNTRHPFRPAHMEAHSEFSYAGWDEDAVRVVFQIHKNDFNRGYRGVGAVRALEMAEEWRHASDKRKAEMRDELASCGCKSGVLLTEEDVVARFAFVENVAVRYPVFDYWFPDLPADRSEQDWRRECFFAGNYRVLGIVPLNGEAVLPGSWMSWFGEDVATNILYLANKPPPLLLRMARCQCMPSTEEPCQRRGAFVVDMAYFRRQQGATLEQQVSNCSVGVLSEFLISRGLVIPGTLKSKASLVKLSLRLLSFPPEQFPIVGDAAFNMCGVHTRFMFLRYVRSLWRCVSV